MIGNYSLQIIVLDYMELVSLFFFFFGYFQLSCIQTYQMLSFTTEVLATEPMCCVSVADI